jgi:hypothetical protein
VFGWVLVHVICLDGFMLVFWIGYGSWGGRLFKCLYIPGV